MIKQILDKKGCSGLIVKCCFYNIPDLILSLTVSLYLYFIFSISIYIKKIYTHTHVYIYIYIYINISFQDTMKDGIKVLEKCGQTEISATQYEKSIAICLNMIHTMLLQNVCIYI